MKPLLVVFGHIHFKRGVESIAATPSQREYDFVVAGGGSWQAWLSVVFLLWLVLMERLWPSREVEEIIFVNAACFKGDAGTVITL